MAHLVSISFWWEINQISKQSNNFAKDSRKVAFEEGLRFAKQRNIPFIETSAKNGTNVEEIFNILTETTLSKIEQNQVQIREHPGIKVGTEKYIPAK